jgi:hypothetical protein
MMAQERNGGGFMGYGYGEGEDRVSALRDMLDGGGRGQYGDTFQGGPLSGLLNAIGVRPLGYNDRMGDGGGATMSAMAPMQSMMPVMRPNVAGSNYPRRPDGIGATPGNAYVPYYDPTMYGSGMNPSNAYVPFSQTLGDGAAQIGDPGYSEVLPPPRVPGYPAAPMSVNPNDYYSAMLAGMQRFR